MADEASGTAAAAGVIILIALFFVGYLILLPEKAREDVLEGEEIDYDDLLNGDAGDNGDGDANGEKETLLLEHPGTVLPPGKDDVEKDFASANLFMTTDQETEKIANLITVSKSIFGNKYKDARFNLDNVANLKKVKLFFNIVEARGDLKISLNGNVIFEGGLSVNDLPVELPVSLLRETNNLRFEASSVGFAFLSSSKYVLKDLEIVKEFNLENRRELRKFEVSRAEAIGDAEIEFFVNCLEVGRDQGILKVFLNRKSIFFGKVVCDASQTRFDADEDDFIDGTNFLTFEVDKGNYIIEQITLKYKFDEGFNPRYFFTIDEDQFEDIEDKEVILKLRFDNDGDRKRADIRVNDNVIYLDVHDDVYEKDITDIILEGENLIKIFAKNEFSIEQLEILMRDE